MILDSQITILAIGFRLSAYDRQPIADNSKLKAQG
ncbi:hypothetical protein J2Y60_003125 [Arcicella sp. BE140]|nr:hypothetical protein [Arcicella sp. BE51]MDR6812915.1 hypothetical protein [Arcicella sp. BE140]MDR6824229.1 hypothetical protein [Arcicella sp. BE139]